MLWFGVLLYQVRFHTILTCLMLGGMVQASESISVEHALGETLVPKVVKRVVTLYQGATDTAVALGMQPVGVVDAWAQKPTYVYLRPSLDGVPHVGLETQPNLELIASLKPDLIVGTKSRHEKIYRQLSQIAPTVLSENVYDFKRTLDLMSQSVSRLEAGSNLWKRWQSRIQDFRMKIQKIEPNWPITASILNVREDHLRLYLQQSFAGTVLNDIGFKFPMQNKVGWGVKLKTKEALPTVNAEVFFILLHSSEASVKQNYLMWSSHPLWRILSAPQHNRVYEVDSVTWLFSGGILGANLMLDQLFLQYNLIDKG